ncbi:MAG: hypothetical protein R2778_18910 [Saprospiraceae bacterium]
MNGLKAQKPDSTAVVIKDSIPVPVSDSAVVDLYTIRISNESLDAAVNCSAKDLYVV